jgi:predicted  nucleic acid-binding Zn-ribbon protein
MEAMPQVWNDDRMDELSRHMDAGFSQARVDMGSMREEIKEQGQELRGEIERQGQELRAEIKGVRDEVQGVRGEIQGLREGIDTRLDALNAIVIEGQRTMLQLVGGLCVALIAAVATLIAAVL